MLAFTFQKSHLFRNPRENICIMHSAFSNYLLLKGRITLESSKRELKMEFPMKFGFCLLTLTAQEGVQFEEDFSSPFSRVVKANEMPYMLGSPVDFGSTFHK